MAGDSRLAVADNAFADFRPHAVAADKRASLNAFARLQRQRDPVAMLFVALHRALGLERDEVASLTGLENGCVDVGAVSDGIRIVKAPEKTRIVERNAR